MTDSLRPARLKQCKPIHHAQISNNRGRVNGWTSYAKVFGICTSIEGVRRVRIEGKALLAG